MVVACTRASHRPRKSRQRAVPRICASFFQPVHDTCGTVFRGAQILVKYDFGAVQKRKVSERATNIYANTIAHWVAPHAASVARVAVILLRKRLGRRNVHLEVVLLECSGERDSILLARADRTHNFIEHILFHRFRVAQQG